MKKLLASAIYSYIYLYMYLISSKCSTYFTVKCMEIERNVMRSLHLINFLRSTYVFEETYFSVTEIRGNIDFSVQLLNLSPPFRVVVMQEVKSYLYLFILSLTSKFYHQQIDPIVQIKKQLKFILYIYMALGFESFYKNFHGETAVKSR